MTYNYEEAVRRYKTFVRLHGGGATYDEIGQMFGITRQAVYGRLRKGEPKPFAGTKPGILFTNGFGHLQGRDRARMMVRLRDNFTCQDCGAVRTQADVDAANGKKKGLKGKIKMFDVHHTKGMCGKNSTGYDKTDDLSGMVTLCHKCHFNRPEHRVQSAEFRAKLRKGHSSCKRDNCGRVSVGKSLCRKHYDEARRVNPKPV